MISRRALPAYPIIAAIALIIALSMCPPLWAADQAPPPAAQAPTPADAPPAAPAPDAKPPATPAPAAKPTPPPSLTPIRFVFGGVEIVPQPDITPEEAAWLSVMELQILTSAGNPTLNPDYMGFLALHHLQRHFLTAQVPAFNAAPPGAPPAKPAATPAPAKKPAKK